MTIQAHVSAYTQVFIARETGCAVSFLKKESLISYVALQTLIKLNKLNHKS